MNTPYSQQRPAGQPASYGYPPRRMSGARIAWIAWCFGWAFLWGLGGFYLADREADEFGWLSAQTGIPADEIGDGLHAFDDLFPLGRGSWIAPVKGTTLRLETATKTVTPPGGKTAIMPALGCKAPEMMFISVDLPAPFSPSTPWMRPASTVRSAWVSALTPP